MPRAMMGTFSLNARFVIYSSLHETHHYRYVQDVISRRFFAQFYSWHERWRGTTWRKSQAPRVYDTVCKWRDKF